MRIKEDPETGTFNYEEGHTKDAVISILNTALQHVLNPDHLNGGTTSEDIDRASLIMDDNTGRLVVDCDAVLFVIKLISGRS